MTLTDNPAARLDQHIETFRIASIDARTGMHACVTAEIHTGQRVLIDVVPMPTEHLMCTSLRER